MSKIISDELENELRREIYIQRGLTLATLCDMLLGENAADRSDDALIRRAREILTLADEAQRKLRATTENWREQCLFDCDDLLTKIVEKK